MTKKEKQFVSTLLKEAADHYSNHSCNDLSEEQEAIFTQEEWVALDKKFHQYNENTDTPKEDYHTEQDWAWMSYFAHVLGAENE
jgi:hypothetical protein